MTPNLITTFRYKFDSIVGMTLAVLCRAVPLELLCINRQLLRCHAFEYCVSHMKSPRRYVDRRFSAIYEPPLTAKILKEPRVMSVKASVKY